MARLLLVGILCTIGLGALPIGGASSPRLLVPGTAEAAGDRWRWPGPPSANAYPICFDARRDCEVFLDTGRRGWQLWTLPATGPRTWNVEPLTFPGALPEINSIYDHEFVLDAARDRVWFLTEEFAPNDSCCGGHYEMALWSIHLGPAPVLTRVPIRGSMPRARGSYSVAYDSRRQRVLAYGGSSNTTESGEGFDLDAFDVSSDSATWSAIPATEPPFGAERAFCGYDSTSDRLFAFGGIDSTRALDRALYSLDLAAPASWQKSVPLPALPADATNLGPGNLVLDEAQRRILLGCNFYPSTPSYGSVWSLDLDASPGWQRIPFAGTDPHVFDGVPFYDPSRNRLSTFAGPYGTLDVYDLVLDGASAWSLATGSDRGPDSSPQAAAFLDPHGLGVFVMSALTFDRSWTTKLGPDMHWKFGRASSPAPAFRQDSAVAFDPGSRRGIIFGGTQGSDAALGDLWQFALDDTSGMTWVRLFPDGDVPPARFGACAIYDSTRARFLLYGGYDGRPLGDTWELRLDPTPQWRRLPDRGTPPPGRFYASVVYDSRRDAMLVAGGNLGAPSLAALTSEVWALSFADGDSWQRVVTQGLPPAPRFGNGAVYDARRDRMIEMWGYAYSGGRPDCGELDLADGATWRDFSPDSLAPPGRDRFGAVYDPQADAMIVVGGSDPRNTDSYFPAALVADFSANPITSPPVLHGPPLALLGFLPNPTRDVETVAFDLPVDADVTARIFDARGRLVREIGPQRYVAGRHLMLWDGKDQHGIVPPSGMYFVRLATLGKDFSGKFVLVK